MAGMHYNTTKRSTSKTSRQERHATAAPLALAAPIHNAPKLLAAMGARALMPASEAARLSSILKRVVKPRHRQVAGTLVLTPSSKVAPGRQECLGRPAWTVRLVRARSRSRGAGGSVSAMVPLALMACMVKPAAAVAVLGGTPPTQGSMILPAHLAVAVVLVDAEAKQVPQGSQVARALVSSWIAATTSWCVTPRSSLQTAAQGEEALSVAQAAKAVRAVRARASTRCATPSR